MDAIDLDAADEAGARRLTGSLARCLQGALLVQHAPPAIADAFCATRLAPRSGERAFGELPPGLDIDAILERAAPQSHGAA